MRESSEERLVDEHPHRDARDTSGLDDSLQLLKKELMEWVELLGKGRNMMALLQEFKKHFLTLNIRLVGARHEQGPANHKGNRRTRLREGGSPPRKNDGLTIDWVVVKTVCNRFNKRHEWNDRGSSSSQPNEGRATKA